MPAHFFTAKDPILKGAGKMTDGQTEWREEQEKQQDEARQRREQLAPKLAAAERDWQAEHAAAPDAGPAAEKATPPTASVQSAPLLPFHVAQRFADLLCGFLNGGDRYVISVNLGAAQRIAWLLEVAKGKE